MESQKNTEKFKSYHGKFISIICLTKTCIEEVMAVGKTRLKLFKVKD